MLAVGVAVGIYFALQPYVGTEEIGWMCILGAAPFAACGFFTYHGMTAEQVLWAWFKSEILCPKRLMFKSDSYYYEAMQPAIRAGIKRKSTLMALKMDSRTGQVYSFWLSTPADSAAAHDPESLPKEAALRAFADQAGLTSLGDWTWREDLTYPRAIYSLNGQALVAAASGAYTVNDYFTYSGATSDRWYVSIELSLCAEANLPLRMQDDTTNLEKEANPDA